MSPASSCGVNCSGSLVAPPDELSVAELAVESGLDDSDVDEPAAESEVEVSDVPVCVADSAALDPAVDESSLEPPCAEEPKAVLEFPAVEEEVPDEVLALECVVLVV